MANVAIASASRDQKAAACCAKKIAACALLAGSEHFWVSRRSAELTVCTGHGRSQHAHSRASGSRPADLPADGQAAGQHACCSCSRHHCVCCRYF